MHLQQPVWSLNWPKLWCNPVADNAMHASAHSPSSNNGGTKSLMDWISILVLRGANHSNISVRKMVLAAFYNIDFERIVEESTLKFAGLQVRTTLNAST